MFCGSCGQQMAEDERFCGNCGAPASNETIVNKMPMAQGVVIPREVEPKKPMDPKTKKKIAIGCVVGGVLLAAYMVARSLHGVGTPELLQQKFSAALKSHDTATLASLLDTDSKDLKDSKSLAAFNSSLSDNVISAYLSQLQQEIDQSKAKQMTGLSNSVTDHRWLTIKHNSSWLGDTWSVHVASVGVKAASIPQDTVAFSIGDLKSANGEIAHLWPSVYAFSGTVSNDYAKEDVNGNVSFLDQLGNIPDYGLYDYNLDVSGLIKTRLQLNSINAIPDLQVALNDKPVALNSDRVQISPAPQNPTLSVKGTVMGVPISEKSTINPQDQNPVLTLVNQGVAKHALDVLFSANASWIKAYDDGNPAEMAGGDPNSGIFKNYANAITTNASSPTRGTIKFLKLSVLPESVNIQDDGKSIYIRDTEYYDHNPGPEVDNWSYQLQQVPGKAEWWIEGNSPSYESVNDPTGKFTKSAS